MKPLAKGAGGAALAVGVALTAATWAHALSGFGGTATDDLFARWVYDAIIVSAAFTLLWLAVTRTEARVPWAALGVGLALHGVGDILYSAAPDLDAVPVPSFYDPLWLAIYPCAYLALLVLIRQRVGHTLLATRLDGLVCGLAAAALLATVSLPLAVDATAALRKDDLEGHARRCPARGAAHLEFSRARLWRGRRGRLARRARRWSLER